MKVSSRILRALSIYEEGKQSAIFQIMLLLRDIYRKRNNQYTLQDLFGELIGILQEIYARDV